MGKGERQQSTSMTNQNYTNAQAQGQKTQSDLNDQLPAARAQAQDTYGSSQGAYKSYLGGTGAYDPTAYGEVSGQNKQNIETGGYNNPAQLSQLKGDISSNVSTGGYTPEALSKLEAGGLGGINTESAATIRGGYQNLIDNGGISDEVAGAMRRQAAGSTQGVYSTLGSNMVRQQAASGYGGAGGETAQMARNASTAAATATTGANAEIGKLQQTGKIAGVGGLSTFEQGAAAGQRQVEASAAQGRLTGTQQESDLAKSQAQGTLTASQAQQDLAGNAAMQRIQSAGGLTALYNSSPGYVNSLVNQILQSQSVTGTLTTEQAQIMQEISKQPGLLQTIIGDAAQLGGAAGGIMSGMGAIGVKKP